MKPKSEWYAVKQIENDIFAIAEDAHWEKARSYLFCGEDVSWLVDTGTGIGNIRALVRSLTASPVSVLTTHVHWDHIGGHGQFENIHVHEGDAAWLRDGIPLPFSVLSKKTEALSRPFVALSQAAKVSKGKPTFLSPAEAQRRREGRNNAREDLITEFSFVP